jgi:hypothetical protein
VGAVEDRLGQAALVAVELDDLSSMRAPALGRA